MKLSLIVNDRLHDRKASFKTRNPTRSKFHCNRNKGKNYHNYPDHLEGSVAWLSLPPDEASAPSYPLQIEAIPIEERIRTDLLCRIVHTGSGLRVRGQFTPAEASEILDRTRGWDWTIDKDRRPACSKKLLALLESIAGKEGTERRGARFEEVEDA
jgi:hypothetical protein